MHAQKGNDIALRIKPGSLLDQRREGDLGHGSTAGRHRKQVGVLVDAFTDEDDERLLAHVDPMVERRKAAAGEKGRDRSQGRDRVRACPERSEG